VRLFVVPVTTFLLFKSRGEISCKGEGYDTPGDTIAATMFLQYLYSVIIKVIWFKFKLEFRTLSWNVYESKSCLPLVTELPIS
jgi:hypothetical protein